MKKVFCKDCKYYRIHDYGDHCHKHINIRDDYERPNGSYNILKESEENKDNDCRYYEPKLWKRLKNSFK